MNVVDIVQEAVRFFTNERVYGKVFRAFRKKYESLDRIGGTISVREFSAEELEEIGRFFGQPGDVLKKKGTISLLDFEKQLESTRFSGIGLKRLLDAYFGEEIISKKIQREQKEQARTLFFQELATAYPELAFWLLALPEQPEGRWIVAAAEKTPDIFRANVGRLHRAFTSLPIEAERLPLFSQRIMGDPHAFDVQTDLGRMFLYLLASERARESGVLEVPASTEDMNELLQKYNVFRDDLLNFVTCANLLGETAAGVHPVWKVAAKENSVQLVPLRELAVLEKIYPASGHTVWVVENSGVCATLLDHEPTAPIVCTNGQFTLAAIMLLDFLVDSGATVYYSGDFDPEGFGMANRLVKRYGESVKLWHMGVDAYQKSRPLKKLTSERLEKLNGIEAGGLRDVVESMQKLQKVGYQEALVAEMLADIRFELKNKQF